MSDIGGGKEMSDIDKKIAEIKDGIGMLTSGAITIKRLVKEKEALVNQLKECREEIDRLGAMNDIGKALVGLDERNQIERRTKDACALNCKIKVWEWCKEIKPDIALQMFTKLEMIIDKAIDSVGGK